MPDLSYRLGEHDPGYLCINPGQLAEGSRFFADAAQVESNKPHVKFRQQAPEGFALAADLAHALGFKREVFVRRIVKAPWVLRERMGMYLYVKVEDVKKLAAQRGWHFNEEALK